MYCKMYEGEGEKKKKIKIENSIFDDNVSYNYKREK